MAYNKNIVEKLSQFNNLSFTRKQWDIILKGCGCPRSNYFWIAMKTYVLEREGNLRLFTLHDLNNEVFTLVWNLYCELNRDSVKKAYHNKKAKERAKEKASVNITFYMIDGYLTTTKPSKD